MAVGSAIVPLAANDAPHAIERVVPLSVIRMMSVWPSVFDPVKLVVIDVMFMARALISKILHAFVLIAGVADELTVLIATGEASARPLAKILFCKGTLSVVSALSELVASVVQEISL